MNSDLYLDLMNKIKELEITYKSAKDLDNSYNYSKEYLIKGSDDQGIVNKISRFFSNQDINITEVNTFLESAPTTGTPLFNMEIIIDHNNSINITDIDSKLIRLCENLNLDIKIL